MPTSETLTFQRLCVIKLLNGPFLVIMIKLKVFRCIDHKVFAYHLQQQILSFKKMRCLLLQLLVAGYGKALKCVTCSKTARVDTCSNAASATCSGHLAGATSCSVSTLQNLCSCLVNNTA